MAASASDLRSVLDIPRGPPRNSKSAAPGPKKPDGISRELYNLIGSAAPPLQLQIAKPKFKKRPDFGKAHIRWEWRPFTNPARKDNFQLCHWEKVGPAEEQQEYPFAQYNTTNATYTYSGDEYTRMLTDPDWDKEETDYLFDMVKDYEMRWFVIHDRYDYPVSGKTRSIDDLKARYYDVCKKLIKSRPWAGDEASKTQLINTYTFDLAREKNRKEYISSLLQRTPEQIAEEEALFLQIKRLEQTERRFSKERDDLLRTLLGHDSGLNLQMDDDGATAQVLVGDRKKGKRKVDGIELDTPTSTNMSLGPAQSLRKSTVTKSNASDIQNCITRFEVPPGGPSNLKTSHTPVYLRSSKMPVPRPSHAQKVQSLLDEMAVPWRRLIMPTQANMSQLKGVFEAAEALLETKRAVDRVEQEIRVMKKRVWLRNGMVGVDPDLEVEGTEKEGVVVEGRGKGGKGKGRMASEISKSDGEEQMDDMQDADEDEDDAQEANDEGDADLGDEADMEVDDDDEEGGGEEEENDAEAEVDADEQVLDEDDGEITEVEDEENVDGDVDAEAEIAEEVETVSDVDFMEEAKLQEDVADEDDASEVRSVQSHKRRKMSTSSVDTSATTRARRSSKRNRNRL